MNPLIQLKERKSTNSRRVLRLPALALSCPQLRAVVPAPDGGYPGQNTAEGQSALLHLAGGTYNTALGWASLDFNVTGNFNTGVGAATLLNNTADENTAIGAGALLSNTTGTKTRLMEGSRSLATPPAAPISPWATERGAWRHHGQ